MQPTIVDDGAVSASSTRATATATASATPHTKGSWTEVIATTISPANLVLLYLTVATAANGVDTSTLLDIGIGAAGSEVAIVPDLAVGYAPVGLTYSIPVNIPVGSRVAVRCQSAVISKTVAVQVTFAQNPNGRRSASSLVSIGVDSATSHGVGLAAPGVAHTKTAWTQIIAATAEPFEAFLVGMQGNADLSFGAGAALVDIGYGAAGSEVVLAPDLPLNMTSTEIITGQSPNLIPARLPAGTRLAARWQCASTSNSLDVSLYGVRS